MKKPLVITAVVVLLMVCLYGLYTWLNAQHPVFEIANPDVVTVFPEKDGDIEVADSVTFSIDTGSVVSYITPADVERLKAQGAEVTEESFPSLARDRRGEFFVASTRYRINLPVRGHTLVSDSLGTRYVLNGARVNTIRGLIFLPAPENEESLMGTDVLERFVVEYRYENRGVAFYNKVPGEYKKLTDIKTRKLTNHLFGFGRRYYVDIVTESAPNRYILDTGIHNVHLKLPLSDTVMVKQPLHSATYHSTRGNIEARYVDEAWVKIGARAGSHPAYYASDGEEDYALNPLTFFSQDIVIDFPGRAIYMRPHARLASR